MLKRILDNWLERHRNPTSFRLHVVGIPMTIVGVGFWIAGYGWAGTALFVLGYLLQFIGHAIEGNDAGELVVVKKALGLPYVDVAPQHRPPEGSQTEGSDVAAAK